VSDVARLINTISPSDKFLPLTLAESLNFSGARMVKPPMVKGDAAKSARRVVNFKFMMNVSDLAGASSEGNVNGSKSHLEYAYIYVRLEG